MRLMSEASGAFIEIRGGPRSGAPLPPGPLLGFIIAVAAVAFIALLTYRSLQARSIAAQRVTHSLEVVEQLQSILSPETIILRSSPSGFRANCA
jgi:hypothetical protein